MNNGISLSKENNGPPLSCNELYERIVMKALENSRDGRMTFHVLRLETKISRGLTDLLAGLKAKDKIHYQIEGDEFPPATVITLIRD